MPRIYKVQLPNKTTQKSIKYLIINATLQVTQEGLHHIEYRILMKV